MNREMQVGRLTRRELAKMAVGGLLSAGVAQSQTPRAGAAEFQSQGSSLTLRNHHLAVSWRTASGAIEALEAVDLRNSRKISLGRDLFTLELDGGRVLKAGDLRLSEAPRSSRFSGDPRSIQLAGRRDGRQLAANFTDAATGASLKWRAILLNDSSYIRQELTITAGNQDFPMRSIALWDFDLPGAKAEGTVKGTPVAADTFYLGFEHPLSLTSVEGSRVRCSLPRQLPVRAGQSLACSAVIGTTPEGQLRRGFLDYVEDQRAHPFRTFLHYNSWYDLGYFSHYDEAGVLNRIEAFGQELKTKRGVTLDSFLFDDGWDDPSTLWGFHSGFPQGFTSAAKAAARYGSGIGVWMSPWGGYGAPKEERLKYAREQGFEIVRNGFALSGPKYYERFRATALRMIADYKVNQFKIDGTGNANSVVPGSRFDSDFDAAISLIGDMRKASPDLYINLTTGTYPSPFWLRYADSIWRGGSDHDFAGVGSWRQKWITYRDANTFRRVVTAGPLYPLNSLMLHGLIYAKKARNLDSDPDGDFRAEVHDYFGTGTQLQEMYISPELLTAANWDDLAESARWSRTHGQTLKDNRWIGGDPMRLEAYGWAAWSPTGGIVTLRNPSDKEQTFDLDVAAAFELPPTAPVRYRAASPWRSDADKPAVTLEAGKKHTVRLAPFEVTNLNCTPA